MIVICVCWWFCRIGQRVLAGILLSDLGEQLSLISDGKHQCLPSGRVILSLKEMLLSTFTESQNH